MFASYFIHLFPQFLGTMSRYVIILSTVITAPNDLEQVTQIMNVFSGVSNWSVDLEDCDQILRVACKDNISVQLVKCLEEIGIGASLMEVFDENGRSLD